MKPTVEQIRDAGGYIARFWLKVRVRAPSECWLWTGIVMSSGYGQFSIKRKTVSAHRTSWEINRGQIPEDLHVLHRCDVKLCVNPSHLFLGTHQENMKDRDRKGRGKWKKPPLLRGEDHYRAKLSAQQVLEIRKNKEPLQQLADRFGVSKAAVKDVRYRRSWRHL